MLTRMAKESGVETPTIHDLIQLDRKRKGKKLSNEDWASKTDPHAKIAKMKNGSTHLAYKPEHAVDLDTGVIVAAPIHGADEGDTVTLDPTLAAAEKYLASVGRRPDLRVDGAKTAHLGRGAGLRCMRPGDRRREGAVRPRATPESRRPTTTGHRRGLA